MHPPPLQTMDWICPAIGAAMFVAIMSLPRRPIRLRLNAVLAAGAAGVYLSGGLGRWELLYPALATPLLYFAIESFPLIGVAWLMHAAWDTVHHLYGNRIWPFMPTSSFGCLIFDTLIAIWFMLGAPSIVRLRESATNASVS
jgi:hypothetical protein